MNLRKINYRCKLTFVVALFFSQSLFAQKVDVDRLQKELKTAVNKVLPACVFLIDYNPGPLTFRGYRASGVVVKDGMILTAGHATTIGKKYRVVFPDGKECTATGVGKINSSDAGLLKINEEGNWPFVEMGSSASLTLYQPCLSIAYPGGFQPQQAILRFGHVAELNAQKVNGKIRTTCLMEPGDSGGPVFDIEGRVIGIRSSILLALENNFEVPVDEFRAYWTALQKKQAYESAPADERLSIAPMVVGRDVTQNTEKMEKSLSALEARLDDYCVNINSSVSGGSITVFGSVVTSKEPDGQKFKNFIVSKSSLVGTDPMVTLPNGKTSALKILKRDEQRDLVLLALVDVKLKKAIDISLIGEDSLSSANFGDFLLSPSPLDYGEMSLIGSRSFNLARTNTNAAFLGAGFIKKDNKVIINNIVPSAPAEKANLEKDDEIISVNGVKVTEADQFSSLLSGKKPDDQITVVTVRNGVEKSYDIRLAKRPTPERRPHIAERFTDGKSDRRNGFRNIFVHDGKIKPSECGGPLFDLNGKFMGVNIARYSRTSSIAIPASEIKKFIESGLADLNKS